MNLIWYSVASGLIFIRNTLGAKSLNFGSEVHQGHSKVLSEVLRDFLCEFADGVVSGIVEDISSKSVEKKQIVWREKTVQKQTWSSVAQ